MKNSIIITMLIALFSITGMNAQMDTYEIQVDGLGCPFCAYGLEKRFKEFKGIKKVKIEIEGGDFSFEYPSDKALSIEDVEAKVEKAGYTPITTKITRADGSVETSGTSNAIAMDPSKMKNDELYIFGNCGMCEARIVKTAKGVTGVGAASWDKDTKMLKISYDPATTSVKEVEKAVVAVGHDSKNMKTAASTYDGLPGCCQYERVNQ
ncbi:heavy-metal-associated domain-containing protein [Jejudonia soesokkakensis]|uniref:Heavy-metal-associated domain-containing protein n=1 Tax=Jejudonia soesokkakensis TaxID=1323432 RepID=A0ABW2MT18_9FLAO